MMHCQRRCRIIFRNSSVSRHCAWFSSRVGTECSFSTLVESESFSSIAYADMEQSSPKNRLSNMDLSLGLDNIIKNLENIPVAASHAPTMPIEHTKSTPLSALDALYKRQFDIEKRQLNLANIGAIKNMVTLTSMGRGATAKPVQKTILSWYEPLVQALGQELNRIKEGKGGQNRDVYGPVLCLLPLEKMAVITIDFAVNAIMKSNNSGVPVTALTKSLANMIETEVNVAALDGDKTWMGHVKREMAADAVGRPNAMRMLTRNLQKYLAAGEWSLSQKMQIGGFLLNTLVQVAEDGDNEPMLIHTTPNVTRVKKIGLLKFHDELYKGLTHSSLHFGTPQYLPMLVPPKPWARDLTGGYLSLKSDILRYRTKSQLKVLRGSNMAPLLDGLNILAQVPWKVNQDIFEVIKGLYEKGETVEGIPTRVDVPLPEESECMVPRSKLKFQGKKKKKPAAESVSSDDAAASGVTAGEAAEKEEEEDPEELVFDKSHFRYITKKVVQKNAASHSLRCDLEIKLRIAEEFKNDEIYFPWNIDFRGRAYPIPQNLNHMGSDFCRGLLKFAEAKPLGPSGLDWLKCHLCNLFGNNKISMKERIAWSQGNMDEIIDSATNPIDGNRWWVTAENPFQALAACIEIHRAIESGDPESYMCSLPVHQDGSCNGLQHYAALGKDKPGGQAVNLLPSERPQDVYSEVLVLVLETLEKDILISPDEEIQALRKKGECARLIYGKVDRKVIKQTVMTSVYGVTPMGARLQIGARLREKLYGNAEMTLDKEQDQIVFDAAQ
jgi:DNA-directed RNA polymerase, mitochondrial